MSLTPEGKVKHAIKKLLKARGLYFFMPVQNGMGRVGIPDFICCRPVTITPDMVGKTVGIFTSIEAKADGKLDMLTPNQLRENAAIRDAHGVALVIDDAVVLEQVLTDMQL